MTHLLKRLFILIAAGCLGTAARSAHAQTQAVEILDSMKRRSDAMDGAEYRFEWRERVCSIKRDPWEPSNWTLPKWVKPPATDSVFEYRFRLKRPDFRIERLDPRDPKGTVVHSWFDGVRTARSGSDETEWGIKVDRVRWIATEPYPILTVFEMTFFDMEVSVTDMLQGGRLRIMSESDGKVWLQGEVREVPEARPWDIRVGLDPSKGLLPVEAHATLKFPRSLIEWSMRVIETRRFRSVEIPTRVVFVTKNTGTPSPDAIVGEYRLLDIPDTQVSRDDLKVDVPQSNVWIIDEVNLFSRRIDRDGDIIEDDRWTPGQREAQLEGLQSAFQSREKSRAELERRRVWLSWFVALGAGCAMGAGLVWRWRRRSLRARPSW